MVKKVWNSIKISIGVISTLLLIILFIIYCFQYNNVKKYNDRVFNNVYLEQYNLSGINISQLDNYISSYSDTMLSKEVTFNINNNYYKFKYSDLGLSINKKKTISSILSYQNNLNFIDKVRLLKSNKKKKFNVVYDYDKDVIVNFLNNLKTNVDTIAVDGHFVISSDRRVSYVSGINGFSLNVDDNVNKIIDNISINDNIDLSGVITPAINNDSYKSIDTKVSSFVTYFDPYISRGVNLRTGLSYIDGVIVEPGEVFSFYKYAGPYNKRGYVFYYEFVGNGICQIATTVYNAALLGGLEIVKRYPHDKKSVYVPGGLDATVASYAGGWNVDMQFKNTYNYPIYISAYYIGGSAHVDFWSNSNATEGKSYQTESVQLGAKYFKTYLHTYKDGVEIDKHEIASTWYVRD